MTTREELNQCIEQTLALAGLDPWCSNAQIVRGILEGLHRVPPPQLDEELASLLRRIAEDSAVEPH